MAPGDFEGSFLPKNPGDGFPSILFWGRIKKLRPISLFFGWPGVKSLLAAINRAKP